MKVFKPSHPETQIASLDMPINLLELSLQTPTCGPKRTKRETDTEEDGLPATIEVFSGLYVNENAEVLDDDFDSVFKEKVIYHVN